MQISRFFTLVSFLFIGIIGAFGQQALLSSGPMVSYSEMNETAIWVQLKGPGEIQIAYWPKDHPEQINLSSPVATSSSLSHIALATIENLEHGTHYEYHLFINGEKCTFPYPTTFQTQVLWQWRTDPPDFSFAMGSCFYVNEEATDRPGKAFGGDYHIMTNIYSKRPDFMLWLGDNVYLREPDWNSRSGYFHRYTHTRALKELQPLLANTHHYAIWDDHDYGPNDSDRTWKLKEIALESFSAFWPTTHLNATGAGGITQHFQWSDCDFFLLDDRWFKSPNATPGTVLGASQMEWLKLNLLTSKAPFKFVSMGVMFLSTASNKENMAKAGEKEREELINFIQENKIEGVIFLTGDRHFSELSLLSPKGKVPIYDLTCSALTAGPAASKYVSEKNANRVEGTAYYQRNFANITVKGKDDDRSVLMQLFDVNGKEVWSMTISKSAFKVK